MHKLTGKQSKAARGVLKWNLSDLANRAKGIVPKRIDSFEHGMVHLMKWENDDLVQAFKKAGILFKADLEVALQKEEQEEEQIKNAIAQGEGARIKLDADETILSDTTIRPVDDDEQGATGTGGD